MKTPIKSNIKSPKKYNPRKDSFSTLIASSIITTPCEKVLSIIQEAINYIQSITKEQNTLISNLEWSIEIISSRSLYSYEIKEKEKVNKLSQENPEFKELVDFVSEYNENVIQMNRKYNYILTDKALLKPSINLNKKKFKRKSSFNTEQPKFLSFFDVEDKDTESHNTNNIFNSAISSKEAKHLDSNNIENGEYNSLHFNKLNNNDTINQNNISKTENNKNNSKSKPKIIQKKKNNNSISINENKKENEKNNYFANKGLAFLKGYFNPNSIDMKKQERKKSHERKEKNKFIFFPSVQKISITINNNERSNKIIKRLNTESSKEKRRFTTVDEISVKNLKFDSNKKKYNKKQSITDKSIPHISKNHFPFANIQNRLIQEGYDISKIINAKNFDIFILKDLIGYNNVLPFVGRIILENLGLIDEEILCIDKLDPFLIAVNNQYKPEVLYHNCLHGADVTQSCYMFFTYSNAEKISQTNVLDLLSIFIAALGHDMAHPGLNNAFHINDSTDIAITYNDISVLENFHASTLFKTIRKSETNIFEKLSPFDYKIIRKRIISEILATDMALHGKVISLIKSKIIFNEENKTYRLNLLSGDERTKSDEQQSLLDFMIHLADLAHNTRLFSISIKWVELLSEEFWKQGDLEKEHNLPVSFLCDRDNINVPKSQKGFLSGFILSTYECLGNIFPSLKYTYDNANNNLKEWQKLLNEGRKKGWTPKKDEKKNNKNFAKIKRAVTKNFDTQNFNFLKCKKEIKEICEEDDENYEHLNYSVKNKKNVNFNITNMNVTEKNNKKNLNNSEINKKGNNNLKKPSKMKLPINDDDFQLMEKKNSNELQLLNIKKDKINVENKMYKNNEKVMYKKNANKKKNCK